MYCSENPLYVVFCTFYCDGSVICKLGYGISTLPSPNTNYWKEINELLYQFIYDGKGEKIKRDTLIGPYEKGGYKMIDIILKNQAMKISWIKKCNDMEGVWKEYMTSRIPVDLKYMARCNIKTSDLPFKFPKNSIWREIWTNWCMENYEDIIIDQESIFNQNLWFNSHLKINKQCIHYKKWDNQGIRWLSDLLFEEENKPIRFITYEELCQLYDFKPLPLIYQGLIHCIPKVWKEQLKMVNEKESEGDYKLIDRLLDTKEPTKWLYKK